MGSLYSSTSVSGYNSNPPSDDGSQTPTNKLQWSTIKSKLGDPLNTFAAAVDAAISAAFGKTLDGASVVKTSVSYPMTSADQGRLIVATSGGITITTPDAGTVGAPFEFAVNNQSGSSISLAGNATNSQTVDGITSQPIGPGQGCVVKTDGTNWYTYGLASAQGTVTPQGYLTLSGDGNNVALTGDVTASTNVYYSPLTGQIVPIWNGSSFQSISFGQLTLALNNPAHAASTLYDVFIFLNNGAVTIGTGPAWSNSGAGTGARGTGAGTTEIHRLGGIWTNANPMTLRNGSTTYTSLATNVCTYVGTIFIDGTAGQVSCHVSIGQSRKWGVWNAYNRRPIALQVNDGTATWSYNSTPWRAARNQTVNSLTCLVGLSEDQAVFRNQNHVSVATAIAVATIGIGYNVTNALSGVQGVFASNISADSSAAGEYDVIPAIGIHTITAIESGDGGTGVVTWRGATSNMLLTGRWLG